MVSPDELFPEMAEISAIFAEHDEEVAAAAAAAEAAAAAAAQAVEAAKAAKRAEKERLRREKERREEEEARRIQMKQEAMLRPHLGDRGVSSYDGYSVLENEINDSKIDKDTSYANDIVGFKKILSSSESDRHEKILPDILRSDSYEEIPDKGIDSLMGKTALRYMDYVSASEAYKSDDGYYESNNSDNFEKFM